MHALETALREGAIVEERDDFRLLVDRHARAIHRVAYRMTGNNADADDVVQETFLRAYRHREKLDALDTASPWLFRIASNYARDLLRRRGRWKTSDVDDPTRPLTAESPAQDRLLHSDEIQSRVTRKLEELSPNERVAFTLRHYEGLPLKEIAEAMGITTNAVKNHVFRAVQKMRKALEPMVERT